MIDASSNNILLEHALSEGYPSNDETSKKSFARFAYDQPLATAYDETNAQQTFVCVHQLDPADSASRMDDPKKMLAEMSRGGSYKHTRP